MILSDEGGDFGQVLRRLYSHVVEFRRADLASGSGSVLEHLLVAACPQFSCDLRFLRYFQPVSSISRLLCSQGRVRTRLVSNYVRTMFVFDVLIWGIVPHDDVLCKF